ncbi:MAG TPA: hypothetical protein DCM68_04220, partial [Verrucomicrobia bacterium]|nr:hypothetical protein [Verrucomicrobiota bacterium]
MFAGSVLASLLVFLFLSWPLARFAGTGIPASAQNVEQPPWRYSVSGDHLQLLYHFDLMRDMLHGRIPWFQDPYEFNEGLDEARHRPGSYFFPMSAVYSLLAETLGQAAGWNLVLWISVCFSAFFSWMWLRRFTADSAALCLGTAAILLSPFRWISLFGGSPAGIALMWLPLLAWGVDSAVRKATGWSGIWVGGTLLLLFWADLQTFYLAVVFLPVFAAISLLGHGPGAGVSWRKGFRVLPGILCFLAVIAVFYLWKKENMAGSAVGAGRSWAEVRLFSPSPAGFALGGAGADDWIFVGIGACAALSLAWLRLMWAAKGPPPDWRRTGLLIFLLAILGIAGCLAVGVHGPGQGSVLKFARDHLPYYAMIRQPAKVMAVVPLWIGWLLAVGFSIRADGQRTSNLIIRGLALAGLLAMAVEVGSSYSATICLLEPNQGAYERVAQEAEADGAG